MSPLRRARIRGRWAGAVTVAAVLVLSACGGGSDEAASGGTPSTTASTTSKTTTTSTTTTTTAPATTTTGPTAMAPPTTTPPTTTTAPPTTQPPPPPGPPPAPSPDRVVCVGDSVMLGAGPQYLDALPMCGTVDAAESRQFGSAPEILAPYLGSQPEAVVLALGTNGPVDPGQADSVLSSLSGVPRVLVVNVQLNGGRSWEGPVNEVLSAAVERHPNATLVDWKGASDGHPEYFAGDGIHMASAGAAAYGFLIASSW